MPNTRKLVQSLLIGFAFAAIIGCAARSGTHGTTRDSDGEFLFWMTDHVRDDIRNAKACEGKTIRPELSTFCAELLADQTREQQRMTELLWNWYQRKPHRDTLRLWVESLDGNQFEREFIRAVLFEHAEAIKRAEECTTKASRPELRELCTELAQHRKAEKEKLDRWNCQWFGRC